MSELVIDVASYQGESESFFKQFKNLGVKSAMVKLSEGTNYINDKAANQVANAFKVFGTVGIYHFFHGYGEAEARYFLHWAKKYGLDKNTVMALDVEAPDLPQNTTAQVNVFLKFLKAQGYNHVITYGSGSWFNYGRIHRATLVDKTIWVAAYGTNQPGVADANAWQYTDNFHGLHVDASHDYDGSLTGKHETVATKPTYYNKKGLYEVIIKDLPLYRSRKFTDKDKRLARFTNGSRFYATPVKYGKITRLKTRIGYASSNSQYVRFIKAVK